MALILFRKRSAVAPSSQIPLRAVAAGDAKFPGGAGATVGDAGAAVAPAPAFGLALAPGMVAAMASMCAFSALAPAPLGSLSLTKSAMVSSRFLRAATIASS